MRWGVVGTGPIAAKVSADLAVTPGAVLHGVCSRTRSRATAFAAEHGFAGTHTEPAALAAEVDVLYVATPHASHLDAAAAAIEAGTPVLVEKPLTARLAGSRHLVALARSRGVFAMEAMWTRFLPATQALVEAVDRGEVGRPKALHADIGSVVPVSAGGRLHDPAQGGGALLDIGVYPVWLALLLMGPVTSVAAAGELSDSGVDVLAGLVLRHERGGVSLLSASMSSASAQDAVLQGTAGRIHLAAPLYAPPGFTVHRVPGGTAGAGEARRVRLPHLGGGYVHMLEHVQDCVRSGLTQSPLHPLDATLAVLSVVDDALQQLGAARATEHVPRSPAAAAG